MTVPLLRARRSVATVFDLLGDDENDMSSAVGYALSRSPTFLCRVVRELVPGWDGDIPNGEGAVIELQTGRPGEGITDIELRLRDDIYVIVEAKRNATLPAAEQLARYAPIAARSPAATRLLVTLTGVAPAAAFNGGLPADVGGIPVRHLSWRRVRELALAARGDESHTNKRLLDDLIAYLGGILGMETKYSNLVYVVSLGDGAPEGWSLRWRDVVTQRRRYFYPVGGGWPDPPNYLAFRFEGRLQSIHHVDAVEVFTNPRALFPEASDEVWGPHYCVSLGPAIVPPHPVPNGPRIHRSARCWCMLDTLLTAPSVSDALTETEQRQTS